MLWGVCLGSCISNIDNEGSMAGDGSALLVVDDLPGDLGPLLGHSMSPSKDKMPGDSAASVDSVLAWTEVLAEDESPPAGGSIPQGSVAPLSVNFTANGSVTFDGGISSQVRFPCGVNRVTGSILQYGAATG